MENKKPPGPHSLPKCRHGKTFNPHIPCVKCREEEKIIKKLIHPLIDDYWKSKGNDDLYHIVFRAYRMGMRHDENLENDQK